MTLKAGLKIALKTLVSLGILWMLSTQLKPEQLQETLEALPWYELALLVGLYLGGQFISTLRWHTMALDMGLAGRRRDFYTEYLIGMFLNLFLPTAIGGDVGRAWMLARRCNCSWVQAFLSAFAERSTGLVVLLSIVILSIPFAGIGQDGIPIFTVFGVLLIVGSVFLFGFARIQHHPWGHRLVERFVLKQHYEESGFRSLWPRFPALCKGIGYSILFHGMNITTLWFILRELEHPISWPLGAVIYAVSTASGMIPVSLNGLGLREGAAVLLLSRWAGVPHSVGVAFSLVWLSVMLLSSLPGGLLLLKRQFKSGSRASAKAS